jgi:D-alanyl-D-alanine endopeptidase (penicillin-binding protein 7)
MPLAVLLCSMVLPLASLNAAAAARSGAAEASSAGARKAAAAPARSAVKAKARKRAVAGNGLRLKARAKAPPPVPSLGQLAGLHATEDELDLKSSVALVVDQDTDEVLFSKNPNAVLPIASITKLMAALVVTEAGLSLDDPLTVSLDDVAATSNTRSRLLVGTELTRGEMLHLSLMASENRAAHVLGRTYPGGLEHFVQQMNRKARELGMADTRYVEPTGLSSDNRSSAHDLALLVKAAAGHPILRQMSTSQEAVVGVGPAGPAVQKQVQFRNTNGLVRNPEWEIGLQKTGYIAAAGRCLVMQAQLAGRKLIMVLLDSAGKYSRIGDAERIRNWLIAAAVPAAAPPAGHGAGLLAPQPR